MTGVDRYVIDSYGPDDEALLEGLRWLVRQGRERGSEGAIVVPAVDNIESLGRVIGRDLAAYGRTHRRITLNGLAVQLFTPRTQPGTFDGPVLVPWAHSGMVEGAERLQPAAICATGWYEGGLDEWKRAWAPTDPRTGEAESSGDEAPPAVTGAVDSLSGPFGNDVIHPMDKARAINAFKALHAFGIPTDPAVVRTLAIQRDWEPDAADRLREIARKIGEGRAVRGGDRLTQTKAKELVARFERERE